MQCLGFQRVFHTICCLIIWLACTGADQAYANSKQTLRFTHISQEQGLSDGSIPSIYQDEQGLMWLGTSTGLVRFDGRHAREWKANPEDENSLSGPLVPTIKAN